MKKSLPHRMTVPAARRPFRAGEAIAAIQDFRELDAAKSRDGEKCGRLHLDYDAAFVSPPFHTRTGLAIDCVGGPRLAAVIIVIVLSQYCLDCP